MINLQLDLCAMPDNRPPQQLMRDLGISYARAVPQSMVDCWQFFECENVPDHLPDCLTETKGTT